MRESKLTDKDMSTLREADVAKTQRDKQHGDLRDYSLQHKVEMRWGLNAEAEKDQIFELTIDGVSVLLDWEQVMRYGRFI